MLHNTMKRNPRRFVMLLITGALFFLLTNCQDVSRFFHYERPIHDGLLNLRQGDEGKVIRLVGEWLIQPASADYEPGMERDLIPERAWYSQSVPGIWTSLAKMRDMSGPLDGSYVYALELRGPQGLFQQENPPTLYLNEVSTAYILFVKVDGGKWTRVGGVGNVADDRKTFSPSYTPRAFPMEPFETMRIRLLVSDYELHGGGITAIPLLGSKKAISRLILQRKTVDFFMTGVIFILGFYHGILFLLDKTRRSALYFAGFSMIIALRTPITAHYLEAMFPGVFTFTLSLKLSYLTFYVGVPLFYAFLSTLFERESKHFSLSVYLIGLISSLFVIITPPDVFTRTLAYYQAYTVALILVLSYWLVLDYQRRRSLDTVAMITGFLILAGTTINDILYYNFIINTGNISHHGLFIFTFIQVFLIARTNVRNKEHADYLSNNLSAEVERKKSELANTLNVLQDREHQQRAELEVAYDIQEHIMAELPGTYPGFAITGFLIYKERVGGDYYDILPLAHDRTAVLITDASGHGIPAALVTAMAKIGFTDAIYSVERPSEVMYRVNERILKSLKKDNYLTALLAVVGPGPSITMSSASHQWPIFYRRHDGHAFEMELQGGLFLGVFENQMQNFSDITISLQPGDRILMFTDGLPEQNNAEDEIFGYDRIIDLMHRTAHMSIDDARNTIRWEWEVFHNGIPTRDDTAVLLIEGREW